MKRLSDINVSEELLKYGVPPEYDARTKMADDAINPNHYTGGRQYEPRKVIRDWGLNFNLGNSVKYISRAGRKDDIIQDLEKAKRYIEFEIEALKEERTQS